MRMRGSFVVYAYISFSAAVPVGIQYLLGNSAVNVDWKRAVLQGRSFQGMVSKRLVSQCSNNMLPEGFSGMIVSLWLSISGSNRSVTMGGN
jgi:hypothetical protein